MGYFLGIDLGTTFTAAATRRDGTTEMVSLGNRAASIPTLVFLREDEDAVRGRRGGVDGRRPCGPWFGRESVCKVGKSIREKGESHGVRLARGRR